MAVGYSLLYYLLLIVLDEYWSINFLKSSTDAAHATSWGKLFHGSTTLLIRVQCLLLGAMYRRVAFLRRGRFTVNFPHTFRVR